MTKSIVILDKLMVFILGWLRRFKGKRQIYNLIYLSMPFPSIVFTTIGIATKPPPPL